MDKQKAYDIVNTIGGICASEEEVKEACKILTQKTGIKQIICPDCGEDLELIYPEKDERICKFKCGHTIYKTVGLFNIIVQQKRAK